MKVEDLGIEQQKDGENLGGGNSNICYFHPGSLGFHDPI